ncbi:hypothetical protein FC39_GL000880 [Lactobacillus hamsteri DSM 5661 = JCM 6256]|uniref:Uncharacterized protein n=2 Tax=Lactobacillus hamsteri TaxID=96565 RepID=A0A0R1YCX3_9LACO|nr:hypothetical protein FC39_GL000880 [Lactobacillus hamsteri DSM 5661 = JCM 6256]
MDILNAPTPEEAILAKIGKWIFSSYITEHKSVTVIFKKDTPKNILNLFQKNTDLFIALTDYKVNKTYEIAK